jgi:hypothetical protein
VILDDGDVIPALPLLKSSLKFIQKSTNNIRVLVRQKVREPTRYDWDEALTTQRGRQSDAMLNISDKTVIVGTWQQPTWYIMLTENFG